MTRQFHKALRTTSTRKPTVPPNPRTLSFTCFRLVPIHDHEPGDPPYAAIELTETQNAMRAFVKRPPRQIKRAA